MGVSICKRGKLWGYQSEEGRKRNKNLQMSPSHISPATSPSNAPSLFLPQNPQSHKPSSNPNLFTSPMQINDPIQTNPRPNPNPRPLRRQFHRLQAPLLHRNLRLRRHRLLLHDFQRNPTFNFPLQHHHPRLLKIQNPQSLNHPLHRNAQMRDLTRSLNIPVSLKVLCPSLFDPTW